MLSGTGRYADPWHPFADTSAALAGLLEAAGLQVIIPDDVDTALADLVDTDDTALPSLLAINVGLPRDGDPSPGTPGAAAGLSRWLASELPLLVSHSSSTSFTDLPAWEEGLGGRWIRGTSMHPEYGPASIDVLPCSGPVVSGVPNFDLLDERYSFLRTSPDITVHATHTHEGMEHPVLWSLERRSTGTGSGGRTFYDALGHDAASYQSREHCRILSQAIAWLTCP
nr:ThuA domain-containing protein [Pseudarthrobacter sp. C4D7]